MGEGPGIGNADKDVDSGVAKLFGDDVGLEFTIDQDRGIDDRHGGSVRQDYFLAEGIGGHFGGFVQSAKDVPSMVAIDGCEVGCAKAILDHAEVPAKNYLVLTELGIEKNKDFNLKTEDIQKVKTALKSLCE